MGIQLILWSLRAGQVRSRHQPGWTQGAPGAAPLSLSHPPLFLRKTRNKRGCSSSPRSTPPTSEGFAQPGAISVVPALPRGRARRERRNSQSPPPAPQDQLWQLFPIEPGTALQEKNREQKVGENPSFQGKEGNDQENRKVSLVPNTRRPDLTPPHCPLPDRSARAGHSFPGTAWHGGPSPSLFPRRDPRTRGRTGLRA